MRNKNYVFTIATAILLTLNACGFTPVYNSDTGVESVTVKEAFSYVDIAPIPDKIGVDLRNELLDMLHVNTGQSVPHFTLIVKTPNEYIKQTGIDRDATTTREQLRLKTSAKLVSKETGRILFDRDFVSLTNYNILPSEYSTLIAQEDARDRAMRQIADDIKTHLALYFSNNDLPGSQ